MAKHPKRYGGNSNRDHEQEEGGSRERHGGARRASEADSWEREEDIELDSDGLDDPEELDSGETGR